MLALITGASSGIGEALAHQLSAKGYELIVTGRNRKQLDTLPGETLVADLAKDTSPVVEILRTRAPDLVINNAGYGLYGHALSRPTEESLEMLRLNIMAATELTLEGARAMQAAGKQGTILNVSSVAGFFTFPHFSLYAASKTYVTQLSRSLDFEFRPQGIRVLAACPGQVRTGFRQRAGGDQGESNGFEVMSAEYAARRMIRQIDRGQGVATFHWPYRLLRVIYALLPFRKLKLRFLRNSINERYPHR